MIEELLAWTNDRPMGRVLRDAKRDRLTFVYEKAWRDDPTSFPLSLSMPLSSEEHGHAPVSAFMWGLLPDNDGVLKRWGEKFQVSPRNVFRLLEHVGEDCAGAVQFVKPGRIEEWRGSRTAGRVQWIDDAEIADRLRLLLKDHSASRKGTDRGHFSLAGAQPKTALHYEPTRDRWGVPSGTVPTTHIFKPPSGDFDGYAENEHFCMALARVLGLAAASSTIMKFDDVPVIVVERYDRVRQGRSVSRIHQEDMCQAIGHMPQQKYQSEGGPSATDIVSILRHHSSAREVDEARFMDALIFNWLICGTDAHAKNYSLLIGAGGRVRLAPLYDLSSALAYPQQVHPRDATMAMKIGNQYKLHRIGLREWGKCAATLRHDEETVRARILALAQTLPDAAAQVHNDMRAKGIRHTVTLRLVNAMRERAAACATMVVG